MGESRHLNGSKLLLLKNLPKFLGHAYDIMDLTQNSTLLSSLISHGIHSPDALGNDKLQEVFLLFKSTY